MNKESSEVVIVFESERHKALFNTLINKCKRIDNETERLGLMLLRESF